MREIAEKKNLFEMLSELGYNAKDVAGKLRVKNLRMTIAEYLDRYEHGGMKHKLFNDIAARCLFWCQEQESRQLIPIMETDYM